MSQSQTIFFPWIYPGMNEIIAMAKRRGKGGPMLYANFKREWTRQTCLYVKALRIMPVARAFIHFEWKERHRLRDPDNIAAGGRKFILDGLVAAGVLVNDGWKHVGGWTDRFSTVPVKEAGVVVELEEI